jgi:hypothetical protein
MTRLPKRNEGFDNDVFFDIEAKRTRSIVGKIYFEVKRNKLILKCESSEAKPTGLFRKFTISKRSKQVP